MKLCPDILRPSQIKSVLELNRCLTGNDSWSVWPNEIQGRRAGGNFEKVSSRDSMRGTILKTGTWIGLSVSILILGSSLAVAQSQASSISNRESDTPTRASSSASGTVDQSDPRSVGSISGIVAVQNGALASGALVSLTREGQPAIEVTSGENGEFSFTNQAPGAFRLTITAKGFQTKTFSGNLRPGMSFVLPEIVLSVARATTEVNVTYTTEEIAEQQIKYQLQQRVLGFIPNFYASYVPDAAPLVPRQKFQLAWKSVTDPITIVGAGFLAGIYQAGDVYPGYGQGAEGYAKRFGATYGDVFIGTFIDSALLPSLLKQDPRYFYRGTGSTKSRLLYALGNAVICKGDNKKYQPNYSAIIGSFITTSISYTYYPPSDRNASLFMQASLIRIAEGSVAGLFQEFVVRKLTPHLKKEPPPQP